MRSAFGAALLLFALPAAAPAADQPRIARLARDLDRVESVRAIKDLQYALVQDIEAGRWSEAGQHFAADAIASWQGGGTGTQGRSRIAGDLRTRFGLGPDGAARTLHVQILLSPVVTLAADARRAKGRWHEVSMLGRFGGDASWAGGIFENDYARGPDGRWRITRLTYHPVFRGLYATGWHNVDQDQAPVPFHYDAASVGRSAMLGGSAPAMAADPKTSSIGGRIERITDADAVANLQNAYGYYVDRKMWDDVADLFVESGTLADGVAPPVAGGSAIRTALAAAGPFGSGEINDHVQANIRICVASDGLHARARGLDLGMTGRNDGKAYWSLGLFDNDYVKQDGRWRIAAVRMLPRMKADYALGWAGSALVQPQHDAASDRAFTCTDAPDRPNAPSLDGPALDRAEQHLTQAAGRDAIEHLTSAFGNYIDDYRWDDLGKLFAPDGRREAPGVGFYVGPERITRMQRTRYGDYRSPRVSIPIHTMTQPVISMSADGTSAKARMRLLQFNTALNSDGSMMAGIYENEAVLLDGVWKFRTVEIDHTLQTANYADGWTRIPDGLGQRMIPQATKLLEQFPPDSPNVGEIYAPYPARGMMWFHYDNPVSGRAPALRTPKTAAVVSRRTDTDGR